MEAGRRRPADHKEPLKEHLKEALKEPLQIGASMPTSTGIQ